MSSRDSLVDCIVAKAELPQLPPRHHAVLRHRQLGDPVLPRPPSLPFSVRGAGKCRLGGGGGHRRR
jgi:hypothetical protein